jgi:hypothetical protein
MNAWNYVLLGFVVLSLLLLLRRQVRRAQKRRAIAAQMITCSQIDHDLELLRHLRTTGVSPKEILSIFLRDSSLDRTAVVQMNYEYLRGKQLDAHAIIFGLEVELGRLRKATRIELTNTVTAYEPRAFVIFHDETTTNPSDKCS